MHLCFPFPSAIQGLTAFPTQQLAMPVCLTGDGHLLRAGGDGSRWTLEGEDPLNTGKLDLPGGEGDNYWIM